MSPTYHYICYPGVGKLRENGSIGKGCQLQNKISGSSSILVCLVYILLHPLETAELEVVGP